MLPKFTSKVFLAPMMNITDPAFRLLCRENGAGLVYTELTSVNSIVAKEKEIKNFVEFSEKERPIAIQLFGSDKELLIRAAKIVEPYFDIIDYNMGCPSAKITKQMAGAALLQKPKIVRDLLSSLVDAVDKPVTLKIRAGVDKPDKFLKIAEIAEETGIQMITLHARTLEQGYSGEADWSLIKKLKENVSIPVVGNGDIQTPEDAKKMLEETGCDYVMIGRAARGDHFIFKQANDFLKTGKYDDYDRIEGFRKYLKYAKKFNINFSAVRAQAMYFTKGMKGGAEIRCRLSRIKDLEELKNSLEKI
ncbi:MAG: tRNA dihydrouridine synthase DusB [Nanoarchaeota archaeon]|nr:tRNA dihydrouridine synthase DusB [Nanoarchaeota archaeon]